MRTIIVAVALTIGDNTPAPEDMDFDGFTDYLMGSSEHLEVVAVLDREQPGNNVEPQIFTAYDNT